MWSSLSFLAATDLGDTFRRQIRGASIAFLGAIVGLAGLVFCLIALHSWLMLRATPIEASLIIAAGLLTASVALLAAAAFARRSRKNSSGMASTAIVAAPIAMRLIGRRLDFRTVGIAGVLALGAIVGRQLGRGRI
jgi:apolipoprotein N-acyltransferase